MNLLKIKGETIGLSKLLDEHDRVAKANEIIKKYDIETSENFTQEEREKILHQLSEYIFQDSEQQSEEIPFSSLDARNKYRLGIN